MRDAFTECHPVVNFVFYIGALVMGMCFLHPLFLVLSLFCSMAYYGVVKRQVLKYLGSMLGIFILLSVVNPLFNTQGEHVLFSYFGGRAYTLEALCYGMALAGMLLTILTWFATYNEVMTDDKFLYCFGKLSPSLSLILTMVLRLVPSFQKKCDQIAGARRCIGKSVENGTTYEKVEHGLTIISALTSWALEGGVVMADSMRSRGFGSGKRTCFSIYSMRGQDRRLIALMGVLMAVIFLSSLKDGTNVTYTPVLSFSGRANPWTLLGGAAYFIFLSIPTVLSLKEAVTWHILRSRI